MNSMPEFTISAPSVYSFRDALTNSMHIYVTMFAHHKIDLQIHWPICK